MNIKALRYTDLERAAKALKRTGKSLKTINRYLAAISGALRWAWKNDHLDRLIPIPWTPEGKGRIIFVPERDDVRVVRWLLENKWQTHATLYQVLVTTGLRISELTTLEAHRIESEWLRLGNTKNGDDRSVPIEPRLAEALRTVVREGRLPCYNTIYKGFVRASKALELDVRVTPHVLRHTTATRLNSKGVPTAVIKALLGHRTLSTTLQYAHTDGKALQDAARLLWAAPRNSPAEA